MPARSAPVTRKPSGPPRTLRPGLGGGLPWWKKALLATGLLFFLAGAGIFVYYYVRFSRIIDARLSGEVFNKSSLVFAAPAMVRVGQAGSPVVLAARLRKARYAEDEEVSRVGTYKLENNRLEIYPGPASFFTGDVMHEGPAALEFRDGHLASITALDRRAPLDSYWLEPEIVTTLFDQSRSKRRLVRYQDLPQVLIHAVLATEDHRFFSHHGVNFYRIIAAAIADIRAEERIQGGSTLTMQLARNFFLTPQRTIRRKVAEIFLALLLEQRLSKEQIFELYANQIYLGQRGTFSIYGVGEAAGAYFNKDVNSLSAPEAALLAGLVRGPNLYSPYKYPARALERRNFVIRRMLEEGFIDPSEAEKASAAPLGLAQQNVEGSQAPFFVDIVKDQLLAQFSERDLLSQSYRVYTTLDLDLQRVASEALRVGLVELDQQVKKQRRTKEASPAGPNQPQIALVALDPHSGAVRALVGGRDYGHSQLNHALAKRQPGSSFKPFVYAAALSSGVDGSQPLVTTATTLLDEPTTFQYGDEPYEPENYKKEYHGLVTLREALMLSLNVATVRLAEMVGYAKVKNLAISAGINKDLLATPAIALGAYEATPVEIAGAYTIFANEGEFVAPRAILAVTDSSGRTLWRGPMTSRQVLDPRVAYLMVSLLQSVLNSGTAAGVRSRGFTLPAAGKTGTSHDGWFVGFTTKVLAAVWVGYDDDRELRLSGANSALPLWAEFMKGAADLPSYAAPQPFMAPAGIVTATINSRTSLVASADSPTTRNEVFIGGTVPTGEGPGERGPGILSRIFKLGKIPMVPASATSPPIPLPEGAPPPGAGNSTPPAMAQPAEQSAGQKKSGVVRKFLSLFKSGDSKPENPPPPKKSNP